MLTIRAWPLLSIFLFSLLVFPGCQDRIFDSPFDPEASEALFEVVNTILTPAAVPLGLAWDGNTLWNADGYTDILYSLNRLNGALVRSIASPQALLSGVTFDGEDLWICSEAGATIFKVGILTGGIQKRLDLQKGAFSALVYGSGGSLWIADSLSNKILQVDSLTGEILSTFANPGKRVDGMAFDGGALWLSDSTTLTIYQVTLQGGVLKTFLSPGQAPRGLAFDGFDLWNADGNQKIYQLRLKN